MENGIDFFFILWTPLGDISLPFRFFFSPSAQKSQGADAICPLMPTPEANLTHSHTCIMASCTIWGDEGLRTKGWGSWGGTPVIGTVTRHADTLIFYYYHHHTLCFLGLCQYVGMHAGPFANYWRGCESFSPHPLASFGSPKKSFEASGISGQRGDREGRVSRCQFEMFGPLRAAHT